MAVSFRAVLLAPLLLAILRTQMVKSLFGEQVKQDPVTVRKPFRVFWNVPYGTCVTHSPDVDLNAKLASYGIEAYYNQERGTEALTIFYSSHLKWPYIVKDKWYNGGLPQYTNVEAHLSALRDEIDRTTSPTYTGLGVLDMEEFRPLLYSNFGSLRFLKAIQLKETARLYPNMTDSELHEKAREAFENGARIIMEASLKEAIKRRPDMEWGYYGYPQHSLISYYDDLMPWLWNISTAFYPSLYIYDLKDPRLEIRDQETISETFRVRAKYGDPNAPIYAYQLFSGKNKEFFYNETLYHIVDATIKKGVDGLILWGSSNLLHNDRSLQCKRLISYVDNHLGPQILNLQKKMTDCSNQLCGGHGRCVSQFYVGKIEHILDKGVPQPEIPLARDKRPDGTKTEKEFLHDYACQCYENWMGRWCNLKRQ